MIVLGTTAIASSIAIFTMMTLRTQSIGKDLTRDRLQAELTARGMIEQARQLIESDNNWRTNRTNGVWTSYTGSGATAQVAVTDTDGNLADDPTDPITIVGTGTRGNARQRWSVDLYTQIEPLAALTSPIYANTTITVGLFQRLTVTGGPIFANGQITNLGTIVGDTLSGSYTGANPSGTRTTGATARTVPDATVMTYYENLAQSIAYTGNIDRRLLAPGVNYDGTGQVDGLYKINTGNQDIEIKDLRLRGTLVIRCGAGRIVRLVDRVLMQPARPDYPVLITDGSVDIKIKSSAENLTESNIGINFNPGSAPYNGVADSDMDDIYPNEVQGLVHARQSIWLNEECRVIGCLMAEGAITVLVGRPNIHYDPALATNPPIGYRNHKMKIQPDSWRRRVD